MLDEFMDDDGQMKEEKRPFRRGCFLIVSSVIILALLGSSIAGVVWLLQMRATQPEIIVQEQIVEVTATPLPGEIELENRQPEATVTAVTPTINRIVYVTESGQIHTINPLGNDEHALTGTGRIYQFPAWSPNGRFLAAIGSDRRTTGIDIFTDTEALEPVLVYASRSEAPFYLYWSPDSENISFLANHPTAPMALHVTPADGQDENRVITTGGPFYWAWTHDAQQIFIHTGAAGDDSRLTLIDAAGDGQGENIASPGYFQAPGISADGRFLSYAEETSRGNSRVIIADTFANTHRETAHTGIVAMGWSPVNNQLAYISGTNPNNPNLFGPLRLLDADSGDVRLLSRETVFAFFWSPNGRYIAYLTIAAEEGEMNAQLSPPSRDTQAKQARQFNLPFFNLVLVDVVTGEGEELLTDFQPSIIFLTQFMPFFDQYALSHRLWSPDNEALVLPILDDERRSYITVIPIHGGEPRIIGNGVSAFWSHQ
jgi:TolB protein